jgi:prepilin-type processing-associated H-X9-DG protein
MSADSRPSPPAPRHRSVAFTLVELLVVIGIIALLIAILLPALNKARKQGAWATCLSNMKQIGNALMMYANENRGYLPRPASGANGPWPDDIINWLKTPPYSPPGGQQIYPFNDSSLAKYLNARDDKLARIWRCPLDAPNDRPPQAGRDTYGVYPYTYSMNDEWSPWDTGHVPPGYGGNVINTLTGPRKKLTSVKGAADKILMIEEENPNDARWTHELGTDDLTTRHAGKGNILFHDMHVATMYPSDAMGKVRFWDPFFYPP